MLNSFESCLVGAADMIGAVTCLHLEARRSLKLGCPTSDDCHDDGLTSPVTHKTGSSQAFDKPRQAFIPCFSLRLPVQLPAL